MRVREFALSEGPDQGREWIRLDVRADFFYRLGDYYYYVESSSSRASSSKTSYAELIVQNFFEGFIFFKSFDGEPDFNTFFAKEELTNPRVKVPGVSTFGQLQRWPTGHFLLVALTDFDNNIIR